MNLDGQTTIRELVSSLIGNDLEKLLEQFKNRDAGIRILARKTQISEKSLKRFLEKSSEPHYNTIISFYKYFFEVFPEIESEKHDQLKAFLKKEILSSTEKGKIELENLLRENPIFRKIFLYTRTGEISREWVVLEFGKYGLEILEKMIEENVVMETDRGIYGQGPVNVHKGPVTLKVIMKDLLSEHLNEERLSFRGLNSAFYAIEGVDLETKLNLIKESEDYKRRIAQILTSEFRPGSERVFIINCVDSLKEILLDGARSVH
jgi:hypothetical protein